MTQRPAIALAQKDNGDCFYLGDTGCTIWQRAPVACRKFDCRKLLKAIGGRPAQRRAIAAGFISQAHLDAAKAAIARSE